MKKTISITDGMQFDKNIPFSTEAEAQVISHVLFKNEYFGKIYFLKASDFYAAAHQDIYTAIQKTHDAGLVMNPFTVADHIENPQSFEGVGGVRKYLASLMGMISAAEPVAVAQYVHELARKRQIAEICETTAAAIYRDNDDQMSSQHAAALRDAVERIEKTGQIELFVDNHAITQEIIESLKNAAMPFQTGLARLDDAMDGGLYPGKSYGIAARKKAGKTALAATISANLNLLKVPHLFICGEMSPREIQQRILNRITQTFPSSFRTSYGKSDEFYNRLQNAIGDLPRCTFFHNAPGITFSGLKRAVAAAVERKRVKGFILDYWQLVGGKAKGQSTSEHLDEVAQWIADYSRKHGVWSITMAQINQDGNTRGSEGIRLAFDQVYELKRSDLGSGEATLEMIETRYTKWLNISGLELDEHGPYFKEVEI